MPNNQPPPTPPPGGWPRPPGVPADATVDAYGNWFDANGDFLSPSNPQPQTPAQAAAGMGPPQVDSQGRAYRMIDGQKWYIPPSIGGDAGGGLIHGQQQWNPQTGKYDTPLDWGKILSMVAAGIITAGVADVVLSGSPALAATAPAGASATTAVPTTAATLGPTTAATMAGTSAVGAAPASIAATAGGTVGALSYSDLLKYGLPVAGNLVGNLIQANATSNASDAQQKYLQEALDYEKEKDTYQRGLDATALTLANQRYGDYQGRIAPWIANGTSATDRQAALLGLPARSGSSSGGGSSSSGGSSGVPVSPEITAANLANYKALGFAPTGRGTGPTDSAYYDDEIAATGGLTDANKAYWFGPNGRIAQDAAKAGVKASTSAPTTPAPSSPAPATPNPVTTQPQAQTNDPMVTMRGPDGSTKQVPQSQVAHYQSLGATLQSGAA